MSGAGAAARGVRAFVALEIEAATRGRIVAALAALRPKLAGLRWVSTAGMHVTLRFLGTTAPDALERLEALLRSAASRCAAFDTRVGPLGMFPERGSPRTLWLGVPLTPAAVALQADCEQAAVAVGFEPEERAFRAHLTLGRWRERVRRPELPAMDLGTTHIEQLVLFRSDLRSSGAIYTPLASFPLQG